MVRTKLQPSRLLFWKDGNDQQARRDCPFDQLVVVRHLQPNREGSIRITCGASRRFHLNVNLRLRGMVIRVCTDFPVNSTIWERL